MEAIPRFQSDPCLCPVRLQIHVHDAAEKANGFILHPVILIAQRFRLLDMENLSDIPIGVSPNEFIAPRFSNDFSIVDLTSHGRFVMIADSKKMGKRKLTPLISARGGVDAREGRVLERSLIISECSFALPSPAG